MLTYGSTAGDRGGCNHDRQYGLFIDIALPRSNGILLIGSIKALAPQSRVVVLTSQDSAEHRQASLQQGADDFLSKERNQGLRLIDVIHAAIRRDDGR